MLPSADQLPSLEPLPESGAAVASNRIVLLVEDEESLGDLLSHLLGRLGLRVVRATDGTRALELFPQHRDHVVLAFVDCRLPDMEGADVCRKLRESAPKLPLLLTSGRDQHALVSTFEADGPAGFLPKPYMPADVMRHVTALLSAAD